MWPEKTADPVAPEAVHSQAHLRELNERIADLERQVAALQSDASRHAADAVYLDYGAIAQEESAAIVYEAGRFYERDNRNTAVALSRYRDVVNRFPNTRSAAFAAERIHALTQTKENEGLTS
jgi:TolA-binding protein